jgi:ArsR family transcriptional regulator
MVPASSLFRLLGDDARLRILRLLAAERLNVSELTGILGIAQSGVSRHLGLLKDAGLIDSVKSYYFSAPSLLAARTIQPLAAHLHGVRRGARTETAG